MQDLNRLIDELMVMIRDRRGADPEQSYVARMHSKGRLMMAQKVGEEAIETALAAVAQEREQVVGESADLVFHLLMLWVDCGIDPKEVAHELDRRRKIPRLDEKSAHKSKTS